MLGSSESMRWNACVQRLDFGLHSHFWGMESEPMLAQRGKSLVPDAERKLKPATLYHWGQQAKHTRD